jgi:hypothetical protein
VEWFAAIFEGEGSLCYDEKKDHWALIIGMTDRDVIDSVAAIAGVGYVYTNTPKQENHKQMNIWRTENRQDIAHPNQWCSRRVCDGEA